MNNAHEKSGNGNQESVIFSSKYGCLPRFFWYAVIPFLLLGPAVLFIRAVWYGDGIMLASFRLSPLVIAYAVCPVLWGLCGVVVAADVYGRWNPQFILVTTWGVRLPKGRFTAETVSIAWDDLQASFEGRNLSGWHVYDIICTDLNTDASARVNSALFRDFDDFATFTLIMARHMGQDWTIKGFWPGTIRGRKTVAPDSLHTELDKLDPARREAIKRVIRDS